MFQPQPLNFRLESFNTLHSPSRPQLGAVLRGKQRDNNRKVISLSRDLLAHTYPFFMNVCVILYWCVCVCVLLPSRSRGRVKSGTMDYAIAWPAAKQCVSAFVHECVCECVFSH